MSTRNTKPKPSSEPAEGASERPGEVVDRLAGLLPAEELEQALEGLQPEQITGPGGLVAQLAGRVVETALGPSCPSIWAIRPGKHRRAGPRTPATV